MANAVSGDVRIHKTVVRLLRTDITDLDVDAFVLYAQSDLALGSGFGTAISVRGGPTVQKELDGLGPVPTGEAVLTSAGKMKAEHIIHAVGPRFLEEDMETKLRTTVLNCLKLADKHGIPRVAFPAMGAGYHGIAPAVSADTMLDTIRDYVAGDTGIKELVICVLDLVQHDAFNAKLAAMS